MRPDSHILFSLTAFLDMDFRVACLFYFAQLFVLLKQVADLSLPWGMRWKDEE